MVGWGTCGPDGTGREALGFLGLAVGFPIVFAFSGLRANSVEGGRARVGKFAFELRGGMKAESEQRTPGGNSRHPATSHPPCPPRKGHGGGGAGGRRALQEVSPRGAASPHLPGHPPGEHTSRGGAAEKAGGARFAARRGRPQAPLKGSAVAEETLRLPWVREEQCVGTAEGGLGGGGGSSPLSPSPSPLPEKRA